MPTLTDRFTGRLHDLGSDGGKRFVHGVYKQVVKSQRGRRTQGEYQAAFDGLDLRTGGEQDNIGFVYHLADALYQNGLPHHAERLLDQERLSDGYMHWRRGIALLEEADQNWRASAAIRCTPVGIQLVMGDWSRSTTFGASIIYSYSSHGAPEGLFEVDLRFEGKRLEELGYVSDYTVGHMRPRDALALGRAVAGRDQQSMDAILAQY